MKKIAPFFLLFIFLFNTVGYILVFICFQSSLKNNINFENEIVALKINKNDVKEIQWLDHKEMRYKDQLYDIITSQETSTHITYYCINDKLEEGLFSHLDDHIDKHVAAGNSGKNKSSKKSGNSIVKLYFINEENFGFTQYSVFLVSVFSGIKKYTSVHPEISSPPPEFI